MPTPSFNLTSIRSVRDAIVQALNRYTDENKKLTVAFYGLRVAERYLQKRVAVELTKVALRSAKDGEDYEAVVNRVAAYYQDFLRITVRNDE